MPRGRWVSKNIRGILLALCLTLMVGSASGVAAELPAGSTFQTSRPPVTFSLDPGNALDRPWLLTPDEGGFFRSNGSVETLLGIVPIQITGHASWEEKPDLNYKSELSSRLRISPKTELRVSFLYKQEPPGAQTDRGLQTHLLMKYSMDYRVLPNLQVGLTGYFYQQQVPDFLKWNNLQLRESIMGVGPGLQYDLGRWSFMVRSQLETSSRDRSDGINSWFRVWYSF